MKALTVAQPWASLIVAGIKTIETRPSPPNGSMCPDGVRGLPGKAIEPGERIAIHAAAVRPRTEWWRPDEDLPPSIDELHERVDRPNCWRWTENVDDFTGQCSYEWVGPLGAIVGTVVVTDALAVIDPDIGWPFDTDTPEMAMLNGDELVICGPGTAEKDISDQLPHGDFTPGRWGWLLTDPKPTTVECPSDCARFDGNWPGWMLGSNWDWVPCPVCSGATRCDPVPARGRQGVWEWTP